MQRSLLAIYLLLVCSVASAQLLIVTPDFPKDTSAISITVDCAKGNQGLLNYSNTNDVYVHIGVILGNNPSAWDSVKFAWATTNPAARATYLGNNKYQYTISNVRSFFNVPSNVPIKKIAILFRNGAGDRVQRNSDGSDMYIPIYDNTLATKFTQPVFEPRFIPVPEPLNKNVGDNVNITYQSNTPAELKIFFNGVEINALISSTTISANPVIVTAGNQQVVGRATIANVAKSDTFNFFIAPSVNIAPLPAGARDGINYEAGDTSIILVLYAPNKTSVSIIGDFNNWTEQANHQFNKTPDGLRFWLRLTGLVPTTEYAYQFVIDNNLKIADPYAEKILDPNHDQFIPASTYPNLKPYPTGKTTGNVSVLQTKEPAYTWQVNSFNRPDKRNLLIYELLLRDFVTAHDWKTLKDTLGYLKNLGINAIELMPINEFEGNNSWGYNPSFYFAPDKYYGTKNRLKEFIDECHKQGIAVILDIALNHSFSQSPMVQMYFDGATGRPAANNPWFNAVPKHAYNVGYDMNHESMATRYFTSRVIEHWLKEYKIDGYRFDLSKGFTQTATCDANGNNCNENQMSAYDASRVAIWKRYYDSVQTKSSGAYVILEHFAANTEEKELSDYGMLLWGNLNHAYNEATMGYLPGSNIEGGIHTVRGWSNPHLITYMESHDEERLMYKNINFGNSSGSYNIKDLNTGLRRNEMAAAFNFVIPGPKMIWQFGELGYDYSINHCTNGTVNNNCRLDPKPIKWDYLQNANRKNLYDVYSSMLKLRNHPLFKNGFVTDRVTHSLSGAFKWIKLTTDTSNILVVGNFDVVSTTGSVIFQNSGTWYDYLTNQTIAATGSAQNITFQPGEYHVYINRNLNSIPTPVGGVNSNTKNFTLTVYPNPVNKNGVIEFELPESGPVKLSISNVAGQVLRELYSGFKTKGVHKIPLNTQTFSVGKLSKGIYFVKLETNSSKKVQQIIID